MATIKGFTSLEQSKKLAKILPIESADMKILPFTEREYRIVPINDISVCDREDEIYAWSLAALLEILKDKITFGGASDKEWFVSYTIKSPRKLLTIYESNLIDACVTTIEKLHDLNLL